MVDIDDFAERNGLAFWLEFVEDAVFSLYEGASFVMSVKRGWDGVPYVSVVVFSDTDPDEGDDLSLRLTMMCPAHRLVRVSHRRRGG